MPHAAPAIGTGPRRPAIGADDLRLLDAQLLRCGRERPQRCAKLALCFCDFCPIVCLRTTPNRPEHAPTLLLTRCDRSFIVCRSVTGTGVALTWAQASPRPKVSMIDIGASNLRRLRARPQQRVRAQPHSSRHTRLRPTRVEICVRRAVFTLCCCYRAQVVTTAAASALLRLATVAASARLGPRALPPAALAVSAAVVHSGLPFVAAESA